MLTQKKFRPVVNVDFSANKTNTTTTQNAKLLLPINRCSAAEFFNEQPELFRQSTTAQNNEDDDAMEEECQERSGFDSDDEDELLAPEEYNEQERDLTFG